MEKHTVSRLIGAPPGYVGFDQGGLLTDAIRRTPHAVLLLDEIEKAHPDLFNILLQVMDHATLTDHTGRKADFRHVILIMTTNAGAKEMAAAAIGFGETSNRDKGKKALERLFSPEFRNRLDAVVQFGALTPEAIERVVDKFVTELDAQLAARRVTIQLSPAARRWLGERGYDVAFGARPMARLIQQEIKRVLADEMLFGQLREGGSRRDRRGTRRPHLRLPPAEGAGRTRRNELARSGEEQSHRQQLAAQRLQHEPERLERDRPEQRAVTVLAAHHGRRRGLPRDGEACLGETARDRRPVGERELGTARGHETEPLPHGRREHGVDRAAVDEDREPPPASATARVLYQRDHRRHAHTPPSRRCRGARQSLPPQDHRCEHGGTVVHRARASKVACTTAPRRGKVRRCLL
jgi:hypothetical protein